jgi:hypothetical protein
MPSLRKQPPQPPKFAADQVVEVVETHAAASAENPFGDVYLAGTRLRGDHPAVLTNPHYFALAGTPHEEINQQLRENRSIVRTPVPEEVTTQLVPPLRDEDAVVPCRLVIGVPEGKKMPKDDPAVEQQPDAFVPVAAPGLTREDSYAALATLTHTEGNGAKRNVWKGQWVAKDDPLVRLHPHQFGLILPDGMLPT